MCLVTLPCVKSVPDVQLAVCWRWEEKVEPAFACESSCVCVCVSGPVELSATTVMSTFPQAAALNGIHTH